jgi:hypothetical protein
MQRGPLDELCGLNAGKISSRLITKITRSPILARNVQPLEDYGLKSAARGASSHKKAAFFILSFCISFSVIKQTIQIDCTEKTDIADFIQVSVLPPHNNTTLTLLYLRV